MGGCRQSGMFGKVSQGVLTPVVSHSTGNRKYSHGRLRHTLEIGRVRDPSIQGQWSDWTPGKMRTGSILWINLFTAQRSQVQLDLHAARETHQCVHVGCVLGDTGLLVCISGKHKTKASIWSHVESTFHSFTLKY